MMLISIPFHAKTAALTVEMEAATGQCRSVPHILPHNGNEGGKEEGKRKEEWEMINGMKEMGK
jgi:hypothetical protein